MRPTMNGVASGKPRKEPLVRAGIKYAQFSLVGASNALVDLGVLNLILVVADPRPRTPPRPLQRRGADPGERQQLLVEHAVDLQTPGQPRRPAVEFIRRPGCLERGGRQPRAFDGRPLASVYTSLSPWFGDNLAKVLSMVVASSGSFLLLRFIVFRHRPDEKS